MQQSRSTKIRLQSQGARRQQLQEGSGLHQVGKYVKPQQNSGEEVKEQLSC
jgi:hypothetical protein